MTLTKKQRLDAYVYAYFCLIAGFDEEGNDIDGYPKQYVCDYLWDWNQNEYNDRKGELAFIFPEWYVQRPKILTVSDAPAWWPQKSIKRHNAMKRAIATCENSKR